LNGSRRSYISSQDIYLFIPHVPFLRPQNLVLLRAAQIRAGSGLIARESIPWVTNQPPLTATMLLETPVAPQRHDPSRVQCRNNLYWPGFPQLLFLSFYGPSPSQSIYTACRSLLQNIHGVMDCPTQPLSSPAMSDNAHSGASPVSLQ